MTERASVTTLTTVETTGNIPLTDKLTVSLNRITLGSIMETIREGTRDEAAQALLWAHRDLPRPWLPEVFRLYQLRLRADETVREAIPILVLDA